MPSTRIENYIGNFGQTNLMEAMQPQQPSTFAQMVDLLRTKSEEELKMLYLKLFSSDLNQEWKAITSESNFKGTTEEDIISAIQKKRYHQ